MNNGSRKPLAQRFLAKVDRRSDDECWLWLGYRMRPKNRKGIWHGQINTGRRGRSALTHRVAWELANGPIPPGMNVLHRCDNPGCVNPKHLFLGTQGDNVSDAAAKGRMPGPRLIGERNPTAKLTIADVRAIREEAAAGAAPKALAARFSVTRQNIRSILLGQTWRSVSSKEAPCASSN